MDRRSFLGSALGGFVLLQDPGAAADPLRIPAAAGRSRAPVTDYSNDPVVQATEKQLKCTCGCNLDIYTCRTTDFTCQVSPAMHRDVLRLIAGGYDASEILAAFVETYGEVAMTEPKKEGFNWAGYLAPGLAMATGAVLLTVLLRKWSAETRAAAAADRGTGAAAPPAASDDDLARLERALREDA